MIEAKAIRTFIRVYSLFESELLSPNIKLTLYKALIISIMTYASPAWQFAADTHQMRSQRLQNKVPRTIGNLRRRFARGFQNSVRIRVYNKIMRATNRSHTKSR
jgi:hypothetical protein